jgi:hypothetical protein
MTLADEQPHLLSRLTRTSSSVVVPVMLNHWLDLDLRWCTHT